MPPKAKKLGRPRIHKQLTDQLLQFKATPDFVAKIDAHVKRAFLQRMREHRGGEALPRAMTRAQAIRDLIELGLAAGRQQKEAA